MEDLSLKNLQLDFISSYVKDNYGIISISLPELQKGGRDSGAWKIQSDNANYIFKIYSITQGSKEYIEDEVKFYDYLISQNIHVPEVVTALKEERVHIFENINADHPSILMKLEVLKELDSNTVTEEELRLVGQTIGKIHRVCTDYQILKAENSVITYPEINWENFSILKLISDSSLKDFFQNKINELEEIDEDIKRNFTQDYMNLTYSIIHGDLYLDHTRLLPNGDVYVFDFGDRAREKVSLEIAIFIVRMIKHVDGNRLNMLKEWFIEGYLNEMKVTDDDLKQINKEIVRVIYWDINFSCKQATKENNEIPSEGFLKKLEYLKMLINKE